MATPLPKNKTHHNCGWYLLFVCLFVCYHYATTKGLVPLSKEDVNPPTQKLIGT
jgi:hypothetical protein